MPATQQVKVRRGDVVVLVGTMKGAFLFRSGPDRARFEMGGPWFPGHSVYHSDDFGATWTKPEVPTVRFPEGTKALQNIWQIAPGRADEPDVVYCGVEPAALFESRDAGQSFHLVEGLWQHPHREKWQPGGGGLCLHTVLVDPSRKGRITVAISTGGVYRTDDGGRSWSVRNQGVRAQYLPDPYPEFGQCVHKIVRHSLQPDRLYLQNHWGLYRSDNGGDSWRDIANGVPSDFGFCLAAHPHDPDTVYIVPLESDEFRCTPEGKLRVYRTRDGGGSWHPLSEGLPLTAQIAGRPIGVMMGIGTALNPFTVRPSYKALESLPIEEQRRRLRDPEMRRRILAETPSEAEVAKLAQFRQLITKRFDKFFTMGNPPDYEPGPEKSVAAIAARSGFRTGFVSVYQVRAHLA